MIRCKVTPRFTEDGVHINLEWVEVKDEQIVRTVATEEFALTLKREGCAYVTRGGFEEGTFLPGTFWVDEAGHRHFGVQLEVGAVGMFGQVVGSINTTGNTAEM